LAAAANFEDLIRKYYDGLGFWSNFWEDTFLFLSFSSSPPLLSAYQLATVNSS
jgi:hypothetical protein